MSGARALAGRLCVVTGAGSGLGAATAALFAAEGAHVVAVDTALPENLPDGIEPLAADVTDSAVAAALGARLDRIDVLATFAGISPGGGIEALTAETWRKVLDVNVVAVASWIAALLPNLRRSEAASIITVASQLALAGGRGNPSYIASKGAILSLTRCLALDLAPEGIRVNCLVPGAIETAMLERSFARAADPSTARETARARHALGRFGRPEEVAEAALFLAAGASSFTTGVALPVDGGWLAG